MTLLRDWSCFFIYLFAFLLSPFFFLLGARSVPEFDFEQKSEDAARKI